MGHAVWAIPHKVRRNPAELLCARLKQVALYGALAVCCVSLPLAGQTVEAAVTAVTEAVARWNSGNGHVGPSKGSP